MAQLFIIDGEYFHQVNVYCGSLNTAISIKKSLYDFLSDLKEFYPNFDEWFETKLYHQNNSINLNKNREITILYNSFGQIVGVSIIKIDHMDNDFKICTFKIHPEYRSRGLGTFLMNQTVKNLESENFYIEFHKDFEKDFVPLLSKFKMEQILTNINNINNNINTIKYGYSRN